MSEKYYSMDTVVRDDWRYRVFPGAITADPKSETSGMYGQIIHFFPPHITEELKATWDTYNYYIDPEGDVSRRKKTNGTIQPS